MNRLHLFTIFLLPIIANAALLGTERTWEFMQSVGGIALGKPVFESGTWKLPLLCDVSGLKTFTIKPTTLNSGLVWVETKTKVLDHDILITIETGLANFAGKSTACDVANLGNIKAGKYRAMYRDPNGQKSFVGELVFGL